MVYNCSVPEWHHNSKSDLLAFNFNTNPKENRIEVRIVLAKPAAISTCTSNYEIICCENLTCKDIITITEYVRKNFTNKILEIYYKYNPSNFKHPENPIDDFKYIVICHSCFCIAFQRINNTFSSKSHFIRLFCLFFCTFA
jgi:hypothetical protein